MGSRVGLGFSAHSANPWVLRHKHHGNSGPVSRINMIMDKSMERVPGLCSTFPTEEVQC